MRIAVATTNGGLEDNVSPVFGRCPTYTIVDVDGEKITKTEVIPNQSAQAMGGAGIQAAQLVASQGSEAVIAGNFGPNATSVLMQAQVKMAQAQGNVKDVVVKYASGQLQSVSEATAPLNAGRDDSDSGFGMGGGGGRGGGMGGGGGRGGGMGGGRGGGRGRWQTSSTTPQVTPKRLPEIPNISGQARAEEYASLEDHLKSLQQQMNELKNRINVLKKEE